MHVESARGKFCRFTPVVVLWWVGPLFFFFFSERGYRGVGMVGVRAVVLGIVFSVQYLFFFFCLVVALYLA